MAADDLVEVVWSGPFHADGAPIGTIIQVTREQAHNNPGWYQPVHKVKPRDHEPAEASP